MNFVDRTVLKMADPANRAELFDEAALQQLLAATYDVEATPIEGPFEPEFERFRVGFALDSPGRVEGTWNPLGGVEKTESQFTLSGFGGNTSIRVDGFWKGAVLARTAPPSGQVTDIRMEWPRIASIDAEIADSLGGLPDDQALLEQERRSRLISRIGDALSQPETMSDERLDALIGEAGASSVAEFLARATTVGTAQITFAAPQPVSQTQQRFPVTATILIRDAGFSIAELLMESKLVKSALASMGLEDAVDPNLSVRERFTVIWLVPETVFDDEDWPGGQPGSSAEQLRSERRREAGEWLAREGIGLVVTAA